MKKVLIITGANGFLGNNIVRLLQNNEEYEIRCLVLPSDSIRSLNGLVCKIYQGDVLDISSLEEIFKVEQNQEVIVVHCAGIVSIKTKYDPLVYRVNVEGTKNVALKVLEVHGKMVYVSSVHAITEHPGVISETKDFNPDLVKGLYAKTKAETTKYILEMTRKEGLNCCVVHPSGLIGPYDYGRSHLTELVIDTIQKRLTAGVNGAYDFVDVRDVAQGIIRTFDKDVKGETFILSNQRFTIKELLSEITTAANIRPIKTYIPMWFARFTAPLSELYYKLLKQPPLYTSYSLFTLRSNSLFSHEKATSVLNYQARPLKETIVDTVKWIEENKFKKKTKK